MPAIEMVPQKMEKFSLGTVISEPVDLEKAHAALIMTIATAYDAVQGDVTLEALDEISQLLVQAAQDLAKCRIGVVAL